MNAADLLSSNNTVFKTYVFYSNLLIIKMILMSLLTGIQRFRKKSNIITLSSKNGRDVISTIQNQINNSKREIRREISKKIKSCFTFLSKVYVSPEDLTLQQNGAVVKYDDPDVERIRRAHLNDLENIPIFLITGLLFVLSNPNETAALIMFRMYTVFRILHTIVYTMIIIRQPARALMFAGGLTINLTMCVLIITKFFHM